MIFASNLRAPSAPLGVVVVVFVLVLVSIPLIRRFARLEHDPRLLRLLWACLVLHFLAAPAQIFVIDHVYHGVADFNTYIREGSLLAPNFRSLHFTLAGSGITRILGDGSVSIAAGIVFAVIGTNQLAAFVVFAWFAWLGTVFFYRAYTVTFPDADGRRYALMLFFLPSLLFWTSDVSKEALMMLSLGVAALGAARVLARQRRGYPLLLLGTAIGVAIRPNELALLLVAFTIALFFRRHDERRQLRGVRRLSTAFFVIVMLAVLAVLTVKFVHSSASSLSGVLHQLGKHNTGTTNTSVAAGFGSSNVPYSADPLLYPRDIYTVLFDPLPITARSITQLLASAENTVILVLVLASLRRLRLAWRAGRERPYVLLCTIYAALFIYVFAALGNLGLITRERTLLFPFLLILLAIPAAPKGKPPQFPWEHRRPKRRDKRLEAMRSGGVPRSGVPQRA